MNGFPKYLLAVDGGGTGTRLQLADMSGKLLAQVEGGPSALGQGIDNAWRTIRDLCAAACQQAGLTFVPQDCAIGLGLSGVHNPEWAAAFLAAAPAFIDIALETDAFTTLLGAHAGAPGAVVAIGTGSVGEALYPDGRRASAGGWGWISGDEASGAWLGKQAANLAQRQLDGRLLPSPLATAVIQQYGGDKTGLQHWLGQADQHAYARLAPLVVQCADTDPLARQLLQTAARDAMSLAMALDPQAQLPLAWCGGLAQVLIHYLPEPCDRPILPPKGQSVDGALTLIRKRMEDRHG